MHSSDLHYNLASELRHIYLFVSHVHPQHRTPMFQLESELVLSLQRKQLFKISESYLLGVFGHGKGVGNL